MKKIFWFIVSLSVLACQKLPGGPEDIPDTPYVPRTELGRMVAESPSVAHIYADSTFLLANGVDETDIFRVAQSFQADLSVSGGGEYVDYYVSAYAKYNQGVGIGSLYQKYGVKSNINSQATKWLKVGASISLSYTGANRVPDGAIGTSMLTHGLEHRPWDTPFKSDGSYTIINADLLHYNLVQALNEQKRVRGYG